ncbi:MAG: hypothetical protein WC635_06940 [Bacteriovorax sp.]|jgi:hypothetical protein
MINNKKKFIIALILFVLPGVVSLIMQKEFWPFSHYPMFSTKHNSKKFAAIKVVLTTVDEKRELISYEDLFPLGAQCTIKLLLNAKMPEAYFFSPNEFQSEHLRVMSDYYKMQFQDRLKSKINSVEIYFEGYNYLNWRSPEIRRKLLWKENY